MPHTINAPWPPFREWQETHLPLPYRNTCRVRWALRDHLALRAARGRMVVTLTAQTEGFRRAMAGASASMVKAAASFQALAASGSPAAKFAQAQADLIRRTAMGPADVKRLRRDIRNMSHGR